jgi:VWFA-related protein
VIRRVLFCAGVLLTLAPYARGAVFVRIIEPTSRQSVAGPVWVHADVTGDEPVDRVEVVVDGHLAGVDSSPPYRILVDVGPGNVPHVFEVTAVAVSGARGSATVTTAQISIASEVEFDLQQLYVTATRDGEAVHDLAGDDFTVLDEGTEQSLVSFARGDIPFTAALLVDASNSMRGDKQEFAVRGATAFADQMRELDEAKLILFSDGIRAASPFTSFSDLLTASLARVRPIGGTAVNDVLYLALNQLETRQGRRVVVLLSDGVDAHSVLRMRHVLASARRSRAIVYLIRTQNASRPQDMGKPPSATSPWRNLDEHREEFRLLQQVVEESGGRTYDIGTPQAIETAFHDIIRELRDHYVLGYYPTDRRADDSWHRVRVKVDVPGVDVRTAAGYLDVE